MSSISEKYFKNQNGIYVPNGDKLDAVFKTLLQISQTNINKYSDIDLQVKTENGLLKTITANYVFDGKYSMTQTLTFSYDDIKPTLPEVQKVYTEDEK